MNFFFYKFNCTKLKKKKPINIQKERIEINFVIYLRIKALTYAHLNFFFYKREYIFKMTQDNSII